MQENINKLIVHHSESPSSTTTYKDIRKWHMHERKWSDIGYHVVIHKNGDVKLGRNESVQGAHAAKNGFNKNSLGVCICGNFDKEHPSKEQWLSLYEVLSNWCIKYKLTPTSSTIFGHSDVPGESKTCPGKNVHMHLPLVRNYVKQILDSK